MLARDKYGWATKLLCCFFIRLFKARLEISLYESNPGRPVVDGTAAYISTLGMVSKILVENGDVVWKKDSLFNMKKLQFQEIQSAQVYSNEIIFIDFTAPGIRDYRDSLILDPITGQKKNK